MRRVRQHVNPLAAHYAVPRASAVVPPPATGLSPRTEVELGCGTGEFARALARAHPDWLVVGLDIREPVVARAQARADRERLSNVCFGYANLSVDLDRVFPAKSVDRFHLLFPDPWFKRRHLKRRVLGPDLLAVIARQLRPGGELHVATDVFDLALDAMGLLEGSGHGFWNLAGAWSFARRSPCAATSRREETTVARGQRVWRLRYGSCAVGGANAPSEGK